MAGERVESVRVGRQRLRVALRPGSGSGPPLLLCNGIGVPLEVLGPFVEALDPAVEVIRFDAPGVGGSPRSPLPQSFAALAVLAGRLLDTLGRRRVDLMGVSWSGALAQQFALQNPRRCRRLVLASTAPGWMMVPASPRVLLRMVSPRWMRDLAYAHRVAGALFGGAVRTRPELVDHLLAGVRPADALDYAWQLFPTVGWASTPFLPLIRQPTLILAGDDDPLVPLANAKLMAALLPDARLHVYRDGHLGLMTRSRELASTVADFLAA